MRSFAATSVLFVSTALAASCAKPTSVSCDDVCDCRGQSGQSSCLSECERSHADEKASATQAGCAKAYDALQACLVESAICDPKRKELVVPVSACGADVSALLDCEFPVMPTSSSASSASSSTGAGG